MVQKKFLYTQKPAFTFKKWGRKGFSIFSSMHKVVQIATLSTIYLTFATPANAERSLLVATNDTLQPIKEQEVEEVVVSAQRIPVAFSQTARIVQVIGKEELANAPVHDLQDLLKFVSNVDVRQRGGNGVQADISIRGSSPDQVLILLNGIPLNDPQTGHHNLNLPVSFDAIDRIEILEGPASRLYGPNAFSGAINIITSQKTSPSLIGRFSGGQYGLFESALSSSFKTGKLTSSLSADYKRADGALKNTDFKIGNAYYHGSWSYPTGKLEFQGGYTDRGFGANDFYTPAYPNQYERIKTIFASVKATSEGTLHLTPSFYWRRNQDRFELFRDFAGAPSWYLMHNYHLTDTYGSNLSGWANTGLGKLAFGTDFRSENIWSTVLGKEMDNPVDVPGENGIKFNHADNRSNLSLYGEYSHHFGPIDISGGVMANWNSSLGRKWKLYPGFDVAWKIISPLKLYVSVNKSLRMPTYTDLYYKSATNIGNPDLQPEEALSFEYGLKYNNSWLTTHVAIFERWGKNMIDWVRQPNETLWYAKNLTDLNTKGIEVSAKINPSLLFGKEIFIRSLDVSYGYLTQDKASGTLISKYLLDYLKHKIDIRLTHGICSNLSASWMISYQDRNGTFTLWDGNKYGSEVEYAPIWLVDSRINWAKNQFTLFLEASNLLNKTYFDYGNVEQPGVWAKAGIVIKLGK
ncbi:MAG: TonB-dependent receptor [Bacteroidetes bacterium]|nr:TonB-dependent receptor [Bacteroidota bacterium]